jgi:hypothetical protein
MQPNMKAESRGWLYSSFPCTHIATLQLESDCRTRDGAQRVFNRFVYKFNERLWGSNNWKKGTSDKKLSVLGVIQGKCSSDTVHLHLALSGFPNKHTERELKNVFYKAALHTRGIQCFWPKRENDYKVPNETEMAVEFEKVGNSGRWLNYITRELSKTNLDDLLIQHVSNPASTSFARLPVQ